MPSCGPRLVERPARTPRPFGLYTAAAEVVESTDPHTGCGVEYQTVCGEAALADDACPPPDCSPTDMESPSDKIEHEVKTVGCGAFPVYVNPACSLVGDTEEANIARGRELLDLTEQKAVEREFWTGVLGACGPECVIVCQGTVNMTAAVGALEQALADAVPGVGVLHVPAGLAPDLASDSYIVRVGDHLETAIGTRLAFGAGYSGPPAGMDDSPNTAWMVATGPVRVERGPVFEATAVNKRRNRRNTLRERMVVVTYECACFIAEVNIEGC